MAGIGFFVLGLVAWLGTLVAPAVMAFWFWNQTSVWLGKAWSILLFGPCMATVEFGLVRLFFFAAHDDGSGPPGLGIALIPSLASFALALIVFYGLAGAAAVRRVVQGVR